MSDNLPTNTHNISDYERRRLEAVRLAEKISKGLINKLNDCPASFVVEAVIAALSKFEKFL